MNFKKQLKDGLITQNPALVQLIGMCPLLVFRTLKSESITRT